MIGKGVCLKFVKIASLVLLAEVMAVVAASAVASARVAASLAEVDLVAAVGVTAVEVVIVEVMVEEATAAHLLLLGMIVVLPPLHQTPSPTTLPLAASVARSFMSAMYVASQPQPATYD